MIELIQMEIDQVSGGFKIPIKVVTVIMATIGATIMGGPAMGGAALALAVGTQGATNLAEMFNNHGYDVNYNPTNPYNIAYQW